MSIRSWLFGTSGPDWRRAAQRDGTYVREGRAKALPPVDQPISRQVMRRVALKAAKRLAVKRGVPRGNWRYVGRAA